MNIGTKVFLFMTLMVIFLVVIPSYLIITSFIDEQRNLRKSNLLEKDSNTIDKISRLMTERIINLKSLSLSVSKIFSDPKFTTDDMVTYLQNFQKISKSYSTISIYDTKGIKIMDSENVSIGKNDSKTEFFNKAMLDEIYWEKTPVYKIEFQQYILHLSAPLKDVQGKIIGVIVLNFPMDKISDLLAKEHYSEDTDIDLLTSDGLVIYSNHDNHAILNDSWKNSTIFKRTIQSTTHSISDITLDPNGQEIIFAATNDKQHDVYSGTGWILVISKTTQIAFDKINKLENQLILISASIFVILIALTVFFSRLISKPITRLVDISKRIASGDFSQVSGPSSNDEFGKLIFSFHTMSKSLQEYRKKLIESERLTAIGQLSAKIAHDFRNPLSVITNSVELLKLQNLVSENGYLYMDMIDRSINRISHQINEVLEYVQSKELNFQDYSVLNIVKKAVDNLHMKSGVEIILPHTDAIIKCEPQKLEIVFANLFLNAIQAMGGKGSIQVKIIDNENYINVEIMDMGPGIPKELLEKIFDPLFTTRQIGTGLGLPASKDIVQKYGGRIDVKTTSNKGTVFVVKLPKSRQFSENASKSNE